MDLMDYRRKIIANSPHLKSASGAVVSFSDGADLPLKSLLVDIEPVQDLHGQDSPYPAGGGVNKIDYLSCIGIGGKDGTDSIFGNNTSISGNQLTINRSYAQGGGLLKGVGVFPMSTGDKVTISGSVTLTNTNRMYIGVGNYDGGGTNRILAVTPSSGKFVVTVTAGSDYAKTGIFLQPESANSSMVVSNVMVALGETEKPYSPYENICPISGWNAVKVTSAGKNLLDDVSPNVVNAYISNLNGVPILRASAENRTVVVQLKENTTYTYTWNQTAIAGASADDSNIILFDEYPVAGVTLGYSTGGNLDGTNNKRTFNSGDYKYAAIKIANIYRSNYAQTLSASMLEVSSTATPYEPYSGMFVQIGLNLLALPFVNYTNVSTDLANYFFIKAGTYTFSFGTGTASSWRFIVRLKDLDGNEFSDSQHNPSNTLAYRDTLNGYTNGSNTTAKELVLNIAEDCYIRILHWMTESPQTDTFNGCKLEEGSTATEYQPYTGTIYDGTLNPLTGVLTVDRYWWELKPNTWEWSKSTAYLGGFYSGGTNYVWNGRQAKVHTPFICSHAKTANTIGEYVRGTCFMDNSINVRIMPDNATVQDWVDYLTAQKNAGTPVQICCYLSNPVTIQLTPHQIRTLYGNNTIFADTGNTSLEYWAHQ